MGIRELVGDSDCDEVLNVLAAHSVSLSQGLPLSLLQQRWRKSGRTDEQLGVCLQHLISTHWVALTPGLKPLHLRFTASGYGRLLETDAVPVESSVADGPTATATTPSFEEPPAFLPHSGPISEIAIRNQILATYRDLRLKAESRLIAITLSRYWQEMGMRAGDLRIGLDVLLRDGYLRQRLDGMDVFWVLTDAGEAFMNASLTHKTLLELAPPIGPLQKSLPDGELRDALLGIYWHQPGNGSTGMEYAPLQRSWAQTNLDTNALLHALDLCIKDGSLVAEAGGIARFRLSSAGVAQAKLASGAWSRISSSIAKIIA